MKRTWDWQKHNNSNEAYVCQELSTFNQRIDYHHWTTTKWHRGQFPQERCPRWKNALWSTYWEVLMNNDNHFTIISFHLWFLLPSIVSFICNDFLNLLFNKSCYKKCIFDTFLILLFFVHVCLFFFLTVTPWQYNRIFL